MSLNFSKISFRPRPEDENYFEKVNESYQAKSLSDFMRLFLADCRRANVGLVQISSLEEREIDYIRMINGLLREKALLIEQLVQALNEICIVRMQLENQLHQSINASGSSFMNNHVTLKSEYELADPLTLLLNAMKEAKRWIDESRI